MEFDTPWAPTPPSERLAAVRAYVEGEALCDAGDYAAGTLRLRAAGRPSDTRTNAVAGKPDSPAYAKADSQAYASANNTADSAADAAADAAADRYYR